MHRTGIGHRSRRASIVAVVAGCVGASLLSACAAPTAATVPNWVPSPPLGGPGVQVSPIIPIPSQAGSGPDGSSGSAGGNPAPSRSNRPQGDPAVVATHLDLPVGLALLPDGSALVGERRTGRIVRVRPTPGLPVPTVRVLSGLDVSGDGGLLDLAVSPTYLEDGLAYAYITTASDNRVVEFTLTGPVTPVLSGIPKGRTGNTGRIMFGPDGDLYVGTGDAGRHLDAARLTSLAGKVLRVSAIGDPASGNPRPRSPIWTSGHHVINGLCAANAGIPQVFEVEPGAPGSPTDEVNALGSGASYGWPASTPASRSPAAALPSTTRAPGGCAVLNGRLWVSSLDGRALVYAPLHAAGSGITVGTGFTVALRNRYGRLKTVVAAPDGALWLTTSNKDGHGNPIAADDRVIRFLPASGGAGAPV